MQLLCSLRQYATSCLFILQPARPDFTDESKLSSQQNEMKSFGEKLIEVANVSYLSYCKLNFVGPDVKKGWSMLGGPSTRSRWWSMDWGSVLCIYPFYLALELSKVPK